MAFFKFRKRTDEPASAPSQSESNEAMRKRAKYRLTGAAVLVLIGVIGFPVLFDKQPRPIAVDTPIEIPDRDKSKPLTMPIGAPTAHQPSKENDAPPGSPAAPIPAPVVVAPVAVPPVASVTQTKTGEAPKPDAKPANQPVKESVPPSLHADQGSKIQAILDGKEPDKKLPVNDGRFVVQVGAFTDPARAREVRLKVERAGLKTYTQVAQTKDGRRTRVRVGPFATKAEAEDAAGKIKKLDLPATLLNL